MSAICASSDRVPRWSLSASHYFGLRSHQAKYESEFQVRSMHLSTPAGRGLRSWMLVFS